MSAPEQSVPETGVPRAQRVAIAQVDALFDIVTTAVSAAVMAAFILAATLHFLDYLDAGRGIGFVAYIAACAGLHILLAHAYRRSRPVGPRWRFWARLFTAVCCQPAGARSASSGAQSSVRVCL